MIQISPYSQPTPQKSCGVVLTSDELQLGSEDRATVLSCVAEQFFNAEQLVVFRHSITSAGRTRFDLAGRKGDRKIRDRAVGRFTAAMAADRGEVVTVR